MIGAVAWWFGCSPAEGPPRPPPDDRSAHTADTGSASPSDRDGDGFADDEDCAPDDPTRFPGAPEVCNGLDDDCDGLLGDPADQDLDGDGAPWCEDCNVLDATTFPGAPDPDGDGIDQNCDGTDGVGTVLSPATYEGIVDNGLFGYDIAAADFDGDGCDDLLIGQPGNPTILGTEDTAAWYRGGCLVGGLFAQELPEFTALYGQSVSLGPGHALVLEAQYRGSYGRVFLFEPPFTATAEPVLEVIGGWAYLGIESATLLGTPPQWLLTGSTAKWSGDPAQYNLFALPRTGLVDVREIEVFPDVSIATDDVSVPLATASPDSVADVGDRDGDGAVDLALPIGGEAAVYIFPEVTGGHVHDAPEVWRDTPNDTIAGVPLAGGWDLDGDGLVDAVAAAYYADGEAPDAGRVYLMPWLGPGTHDLPTASPARIDGEFANDLTGSALASGDLDGDGQADLVVGAWGTYPFSPIQGKAMVFLGPLTGTLTKDDAALVVVGRVHGDHAGKSIAVGDFDGSGGQDLAIGAPFADSEDGALVDVGAVYLLWDPL